MAEIKAEVRVDKLEAKVKLVEEKEEGVVIDRRLVTEVKIQYEGTPAMLEKILWTLQAGHTVKATFTTPQQGLDLPEEVKEPAEAGAAS